MGSPENKGLSDSISMVWRKENHNENIQKHRQ